MSKGKDPLLDTTQHYTETLIALRVQEEREQRARQRQQEIEFLDDENLSGRWRQRRDDYPKLILEPGKKLDETNFHDFKLRRERQERREECELQPGEMSLQQYRKREGER